MRYWICTSTTTSDQGLQKGSLVKSEEEPNIDTGEVYFEEITEETYIELLQNNNSPVYVLVDVFGDNLYEGSYQLCEWMKDKGGIEYQLASKIMLKSQYFDKVVEKVQTSIWYNTILRFIEIEGDDISINHLSDFITCVLKAKILPKEYEFSQDIIVLRKYFNVTFKTFDDRNQTDKKIFFDNGDTIRIRLTFGDRPINNDIVLDVKYNMIRI